MALSADWPSWATYALQSPRSMRTVANVPEIALRAFCAFSNSDLDKSFIKPIASRWTAISRCLTAVSGGIRDSSGFNRLKNSFTAATIRGEGRSWSDWAYTTVSNAAFCSTSDIIFFSVSFSMRHKKDVPTDLPWLRPTDAKIRIVFG